MMRSAESGRQETEEYRAFYESRNSEKYITSDNPDNKRLVARMASWLQLSPSDKVLDIGSSDGYFLERLQERCGLLDATGIDVSETPVRTAQRLTAGKAGLRFLVGSAQALPFEARQFDKIILNEVIEHVPDAEKVFSEVARVARDGARVFMTAPNAYEEMLPLFRPYCKSVDMVEGHLRHYSLQTLRNAASRHGFDVVCVRYEGFLAAWAWYGAIIYNRSIKHLAMKLITRKAPTIGAAEPSRPSFNVFSIIPFAMMIAVKVLDAPFERYHRAMGMHALLRKRAQTRPPS